MALIAKRMPTIWSDILNLFFPNRCLLCGKLLIRGEQDICLWCLSDLPYTHFSRINNNPVEQLFLGKIEIERASSLLRFEKDGKVQKLIHSLKYKDNKELGLTLGRLAARELIRDNSPLLNVDFLIPVPLHPKREKNRGYNQSAWIANGISNITDLPIKNTCLLRMNQTDTQTRKSVYERWVNVQEIFSVADRETLRNKHVLLIDDVITTGSTIGACAQALLEVEGVRVSLFSISSV